MFLNKIKFVTLKRAFITGIIGIIFTSLNLLFIFTSYLLLEYNIYLAIWIYISDILTILILIYAKLPNNPQLLLV